MWRHDIREIRRVLRSGSVLTVSEAGVLSEATDDDLDRAIGLTSGAAAEQMADAIQRAFAAGHAAAAFALADPIDLDLSNPAAVAWLRDVGADRVTRINEATRQTVRRMLVDAVERGDSPMKLARQLGKTFADWGRDGTGKRSRAELIAITETGDAYEAASQQYHDEVRRRLPDVEIEKFWLTVGDDRVSKTICKPNSEQGWIPYDEDYQSGHSRPLGHPGCRCTELTRIVV